MTIAIWVAVAGLAFTTLGTWAGIIIWAIRLEGRVTLQHELHKQHRLHMDDRHSAIWKSLNEIKSGVQAINDRMLAQAEKE